MNSGLGGPGDSNNGYCVNDDSEFSKGQYYPLLCWPDYDDDEHDCCLVRETCSIDLPGCCNMFYPSQVMDYILIDIYGLDEEAGQNPPDDPITGFWQEVHLVHGLHHDVIGGWIDPINASQHGISLGHMG